MRKLILRMELTLDQVAASDDGKPIEGIDYGDPDSWRTIFETLENVDAMLIGGNSAEEYLGYWDKVLKDPASPANEKRFAEFAARTQHYVVSRSMRSVNYPNASVLPGGIDGIAALKSQPGRDMLMWGGPTVAAAAIEAGLIDDFQLLMHPVIAGRGKRLFADVTRQHRVTHVGSETFASGAVLVRYARA